jgi:hypothetical protein
VFLRERIYSYTEIPEENTEFHEEILVQQTLQGVGDCSQRFFGFNPLEYFKKPSKVSVP